MKVVKAKCQECKIFFDKPKKEFDRRIRLYGSEVNMFCGNSCSAKWINKNVLKVITEQGKEKRRKINLNNKYSKKGEFTYYLNRIKLRKKEFNLTEEFLNNLWKTQEGKCAFSGITMDKQKFNKRTNPHTASIDRIDSKKGYTQDNVQFICYSLNLAKNNFTNEEFITFLNLFKQNYL